jgi:polyketide biosynthesis 3-hydroxy-3-methylglutaryl-CoA synthase-like enzyme PksG
MQAGIEALGVYCGVASIGVARLAELRGADARRFEQLLMKEKSVALPYEDAVSFAVNAAKPIVDELTPQERQRIEMVVTCTESGIDFGKSLSTYVHHYLGLERSCRLFEIKNACYAGTAGLQIAINFVLSQTSPGAKALVVCTDIARPATVDGERMMDRAFTEPTSGAGAVALLISERPKVLRIDVGANGYYGYEVMDTCRPTVGEEAGDPDLSLLSYLHCCEKAFEEYGRRVEGADYAETFSYLLFHTPFGGMVKGAHRTMLRKLKHASPATVEKDFERRVEPGLRYCQRVGNIMGGTLFLALASALETSEWTGERRVGLFSYGSGCCSEFYSGVAGPQSQAAQRARGVGAQLDGRYQLTPVEYERVRQATEALPFGTRDAVPDRRVLPEMRARLDGRGLLVLTAVENFHRVYDWC